MSAAACGGSKFEAWLASTDNGVVTVAGGPWRLDLKGRERLIRPVAVVR